MPLRVGRGTGAAYRGVLSRGAAAHPCALGRAGLSAGKHEGDGTTPVGRFRLRRVLYRADRIPRPRTGLPVAPIRPEDGWCDDPADGRYNRPVRLPFRPGHERLWRNDHLYDLVVVLSHNERPRALNRGSAVFLHCERPDRGPTQGCVALPVETLRRLLAQCGPETMIKIG